MTASTPSPTISAAPPTWAAADWNALRATGLAYVERYAHTLWTDYNRHDPGVTTLELLCYAITDLSQRTSLDVKDLLRSSYGSDAAMARSFLAAHEALPTEPVTELDYRKLLIDVPGVRNAWLRPHPLPVGLTLPDAQLYTDIDSIKLNEPGSHAQLFYPGAGSATDARPAFEIRGFYDITVDLDTVMINLAAYYLSADYQEYLEQHYPENTPDQPATLEQAMALVVQSLADQHVPAGALQDADPTDTAAWKAQRQARQKVRHWLLDQVRTTYLNHRNLGEDCFSVGEVPEQGLVLCADVDLAPGAQVQEVYAQLLLAVDQYLTPPVKRYSLAEMQALTAADGQPLAIDQIFEGPLLANGFIREEDLTASALRQHVYVSDLVALAMDVPGIVAVRDLRVSALLRTAAADATHDDVYTVDPQRSGLAWHLPIPAGSRPQLHAAASTLNFYQGVLPVGTGTEKTAALARFDDLRAQAQAALARTLDAVPVPTGTAHPDLGTYRPLAHDFTTNYGLGPRGLPADATPERRSQVRQFKAYLLFFDQLLSNYLAQLLHVNDLLGTDAAARATYFGQQLRDADLPGINELYTDIVALGPGTGFAPEPVDASAIDTSGIAPDTTDRKSRFLDHLLARFAEDFTEYGLLLYALNGQRSEAEVLLTKTDLAADLGRFQPARGFRYQALSWVPDGGTTGEAADAGANVAGIVRRFARLAGLSNFQARPTTNHHLPIEAFPVSDPLVNDLTPLMNGGDELVVIPLGDGTFGYQMANGNFLEEAFSFPTQAAAEATLSRAEMASRTHLETIFVVEHVLLVPDATAPDEPTAWLPVCAEPDGSFCEPLDPYSFRVSIVLPGYAGRFYNPDYRRYAERILRMELPAHLLARICWVSELDLQQFENAYARWLETKLSAQYTAAEKTQILAEFVDVLNGLTTVYPAGKLYDCENPIADNPLVLGRTVLGDPGATAPENSEA